MSYHNSSAPLADCTAQAMQDANQSHTVRKAQAHAHSQAPAVVLPKKGSFSHDPYVSVIPSSVDEMMRIMESRRQTQVTMRRTYSSPNFFNTQLQSSPQSPLQGGNSPVNFPRVGSAPMFFEEPEMTRTNSPLMGNFGESVTSFGESASFSSYPSPNQAPSTQQSRKKNKKNKQQQQQQPVEVVGPSERRQQQVNASLELPVPASVARQQALQQQKGANEKAATVQQPATSSANSSTDSAGVMTKVYQNGRPMPRMVEEPAVERPKVVANASQKNVAVIVKFRYSQATYRASRMDLISGDYVVVDGDRGMDLGKVVETSEGYENNGSTENTVGAIQRPATEEEVEKWKSLEADETKALEFARLQAARHLNGKLTVEHVNFQFDRQKLTLWYKAPERVYFVPLLKALNQEYKCRIWMERIGGDEDQAETSVPTASKKNEKKEESKKE